MQALNGITTIRGFRVVGRFEKENKETGSTLEMVNDWESLITDKGTHATCHFLKARGPSRCKW